jgi:hypothetical protein
MGMLSTQCARACKRVETTASAIAGFAPAQLKTIKNAMGAPKFRKIKPADFFICAQMLCREVLIDLSFPSLLCFGKRELKRDAYV